MSEQQLNKPRCDSCTAYAKINEVEGQCRAVSPPPHPNTYKALPVTVPANYWCRMFEHGPCFSVAWQKQQPETPGHAIKQKQQEQQRTPSGLPMPPATARRAR